MTRPLAIGVLGLAVVGGSFATSLSEVINPPNTPAGLEAHEQAAGVSVLGQFRSSAAASLYLRTDLYLHAGVQLRPMTRQEMQAGRQGSQLREGEKAVLGDESRLVTTVPPPEADFRGVLGDLERSTSAYKNMHNHTHNDPETAFPLFRLMTWVDPQFITGWTTGAMLLEEDGGKSQKALEFLRQGLVANPNSPEIMTRIGVLVARGGDIPAGMQWFEKARTAALENGVVTDEQKDALREVYRWLTIAANRLGNTKRLREVVTEGIERYPDDQVLLRYEIQLGDRRAATK